MFGEAVECYITSRDVILRHVTVTLRQVTVKLRHVTVTLSHVTVTLRHVTITIIAKYLLKFPQFGETVECSGKVNLPVVVPMLR